MGVSNNKVVIIGHAGHGKDELAKILEEETGRVNISATEVIVNDLVKPYHLKLFGNITREELLKRKSEFRPQLYEIVREYVREQGNEAALIKKVLKVSDIYTGVRADTELRAAKEQGIVEYVIYVDAFERVGTKEDESIFNVQPDLIDEIIFNNGTPEDLRDFVVSHL